MTLEKSTSRMFASTVLFALFAQSALAGGEGTIDCFDGSPARPIEEFRTVESGTFRMWSDSLKPADPVGQILPAERDSTGYSGFDRPGRAGGLEFFYGLDIEDSPTGTYLYMVYNSGFQIWDISGNLANRPQVMSQRDGWDGDFQAFQDSVTELYFLLFDIDAISPPGSPASTLVAVSGKSPVGPTIWDASDKNSPQQIYQDQGRTGIQVAAANIGDRSYAFFSHGQGVHVYDMTRALEVGPCFENTQTAVNLCGGAGHPVWRGQLGPWPWGKVEYLDVLEAVVDGSTKHFLATTDATAANGLGMEIREITDAASLPPGSNAIVEGLNTFSFGVDLFEIADRYYAGVVNFTELEIYDVTGCLTGVGACSLNNPRFSRTTGIATDLSALSFVRYSHSDGQPFLYKGFSASCSSPLAVGEPDKELLLDLSGLRSGRAVVDVRGEEYLDPGNGRRIDYWSSYYDKSTGGFSGFAAHDGMFHGRYFYRAAQTIFDVHQATSAIFADGFESGDTRAWGSPR